MNSKEEATKQGRKMLQMMKTRGWRLVVHENLGWFFSLIQGDESTGYVSVHADYSGKLEYFHCMIGRYSGTGEGIWTDKEFFSDPNDAVSHAVKCAKATLKEYQKMVNFGKRVLETVQ